MKRTQIQIPHPLYEDVKRIAERRDWSVSEVFRRAVEQYVSEVPEVAERGGWAWPAPREMGKPKVAPDHWRDTLADDEACACRALSPHTKSDGLSEPVSRDRGRPGLS